MDEQRFITDDLGDIKIAELLVSLPNYFEFTGDVDNTAYLNWRFDSGYDLEDQLYGMGKGYFETSLHLIESCISDNRDKKADIWIFPMMFNVVHGAEVYLKGLISQYKRLAKLEQGEYQSSRIEGKHNIQQLCREALGFIKETGDSELLDEMRFVQTFIDILYENTGDMTFARYPVSSKGDKHFFVDQKGNITVDLNVFRQWVLRVSHILDSSTVYVGSRIHQILEWRSEMR